MHGRKLMERTEWSDLRQERSNEVEDPDSDSTSVALLCCCETGMATTEMKMVRWATGCVPVRTSEE